MEELTLDQIKTKSELEEDIDFENGNYYFFFALKNNVETCVVILTLWFICYFPLLDLLKVPPGLKAGMDFTDKGKTSYCHTNTKESSMV